MEELVDVLDEHTGKKTGKIISKRIAHKEGIWHSSIHILIVNKDKTKTLLQQRCKDKLLFPRMWDVAVGGHISAGEEDIIAAKRELEEELGLKNYELKFLKRFKEELNNNGIKSKEFVSVFIIYDNIDLDKITLQKEEVSSVKWFKKREFNDLIKNKKIIPHIEEYEILNKILKD